jgi:hypothetical protein
LDSRYEVKKEKINAPNLKVKVYPIHNVNAFPGIEKYKV